MVTGAYADEATAANRMMNAMADVINADGSNHLAKLLAMAAVTAAAIHAAVDDGAASSEEIADLFLELLKQRMKDQAVAPAGTAVH